MSPDLTNLSVMEACERCYETRAWRLADGRYKCVRCGLRYSWTSVWDAVRLPEAPKRSLLDSFVQGLPSYRQRFVSPVNAKSRERFYRLCRAVCAQAEQLRRPFAAIIPAESSGSDAPERMLMLQLERTGACVRPAVVAARASGFPARLLPGLHPSSASCAHLLLPLRGDYVSLQGLRDAPPEQALFTEFWHYARGWLQPYHALPRPYFHLYLGEICFRFNRREQDLQALLLQLMQQHSIQSLQPLLQRDGRGAGARSVGAVTARRSAREPVRDLARHQA